MLALLEGAHAGAVAGALGALRISCPLGVCVSVRGLRAVAGQGLLSLCTLAACYADMGSVTMCYSVARLPASRIPRLLGPCRLPPKTFDAFFQRQRRMLAASGMRLPLLW